jgi:hypothetical protein
MLVERRQRLELLTQDPDSEVPQRVLELVRRMFPGRDGEDLVQLLQRQGLGLGHEEQDQHPADQAPGRVPAERTLWLEGGQQVRPGE